MSEPVGVKVGEAYRMVDAFLSVNVRRFSLSRTDINRVRCDYRVSRNQGAMRLVLPYLIPLCWELHQNLIVRPEKPLHGVLAQLDDLDAGRLERVRAVAFLVVETSPGNHQVWLEIEGGDEGLVKRLMRGVGSDSRANCSGRVPGSPNVKPKYAPDFPVVRIVDLQPCRRTSPAELDKLGLIAAPVVREPSPCRLPGPSGVRGWPDYAYCLKHAHRKEDGRVDRSAADSLWCKFAAHRNHEMHSIEAKLLEVSEKAWEEWNRGNRQYVRRTVQNVFETAKTS